MGLYKMSRFRHLHMKDVNRAVLVRRILGEGFHEVILCIHEKSQIAVKDVCAVIKKPTCAPIQALKQHGSQAVFIETFNMFPNIEELCWSAGRENRGCGGGS